LMMATAPRRRDFLRFLTDRRTLRIVAPFSGGLMVLRNVITPQGLEPFQFSTNFGTLSPPTRFVRKQAQIV